MIDCFPDGQDEERCEERFGIKNFRCDAPGNRVSIADDKKCDGVRDCTAGEDEDRKLCGQINFYCSANDGKEVGNSTNRPLSIRHLYSRFLSRITILK